MKKRKKINHPVIDPSKLLIKTNDVWNRLDDTYTATMTFHKADPVLTIQVSGNTITIDYTP